VNRFLTIVLLCAVCSAGTAHGAPAVVVAKKPSLTCPQTEMGDASLQDRYVKMWQQYSESVEEAGKKLQVEIEKQTKSATGSGNLDLALFWKGLAKQVGETGELRWDDASQKKTWGDRFGDDSFPVEFGIAVKKASESYATAKKDLQKGYGELVAEFTKAEKLEEAVKVRGEIKGLLAEIASVEQTKPDQTPKPNPEPVTKPKPKPVPLPPIVGVWVGENGWGNEFREDKTARNITPKGEVDTIGTWKEEGQGQYSARLGPWHWQIVLKGDEIEAVRYLNGELKGHAILKRRR
jgi:hypothetical protein